MGWRNEPREASIMALRQLASEYDVERVPPNAGRKRVEDFLVRPHVRRSSPSACSVRPSVGQASPLLRPGRPFVWSRGATRIVARLVRGLVIDQYGRAAAVIPQAAACSLCFPTTVPSLVPPLRFAVAQA